MLTAIAIVLIVVGAILAVARASLRNVGLAMIAGGVLLLVLTWALVADAALALA